MAHTTGRRTAGPLAGALLATSLVILGVGSAAPAEAAQCGDFGSVTDLRTKNATCKTAKKVVAGWATGMGTPGWKCDRRPKAQVNWTCHKNKGNAWVKFRY